MEWLEWNPSGRTYVRTDVRTRANLQDLPNSWGGPKINYLEKNLSPKTAEMAENGRFVGPRGPNYNPFFNFLANHFKI